MTLLFAQPLFPISVELVGRWPGDNSIQGSYIAISGNYLYLSTSYNALQIIDISNPTNPIKVSEYSLFNKGNYVK
ncbi:MAG: hypothetical protein ACPMAG_14290, partial [Limisphaerales bacterium]